MNTRVLTNEDKLSYSNFVAAHPSGSFLQSWSWGEFQNLHGKEAIRVGIYDGEALIGTVQFLLTKVPHFPGQYLYAAYGPLLSAEVYPPAALSMLLDHLKKNYPQAWFFRFEPKDNLQLGGVPTVHIQPGKTLVADLTRSEEELLAEMHPKTRYNIKVADKHHVAVMEDPEAGNDVTELLANTSARQGYHSHPVKYYTDLIKHLKSLGGDAHVRVFKALYNTELVAAALMIDHGKTRTYLFGGSTDHHRNVMAPYSLHWYAMKGAKQAGFTRYDWWGIETATGKMPGFVEFKLKWGGRQISYPAAVDVVEHSAWYAVYKFFRYFNRLF